MKYFVLTIFVLLIGCDQVVPEQPKSNRVRVDVKFQEDLWQLEHDNKECDTTQYIIVTWWYQNHPDMRDLINKSLEDGKITQGEWNNLHDIAQSKELPGKDRLLNEIKKHE